ncbi:MAG: DeoR family transcriptional regulator [Tannerellaceae bacterium]|nr:DeoR family transcriptional regulator [Tannerellaceae bacterium]
MAIKYHYFKNPSASNKEGIHPWIVNSQKLTVSDISKRISTRSSFTPGDVAGLLTLLKDILLEELMEGRHIHWDDFGTFYISITSDSFTEGKELLPSRVRFKKINIRLDKSAKQTLKDIQFERSERTITQPALTAERRRDRILKHLQKVDFIQCMAAAQLNGCSRSTALRDLNQLKKEGHIRTVAGTNFTLYTLSEKTTP